MEEEYKNVGYFLLIVPVLILVGFYERYIGLFPQFNSSITVVTHFHAFVMTLYVIMLVVQPLLIANKKFATHRFLGKFSYILAPVIVISFLAMIYKQYGDLLMKKMTTAEYIEGTFLNAGKLVLFAAFYTLAILHKKNTPFHMRYMIATALVFVEPSLTRAVCYWGNVDFMPSFLSSFLITDLILIGLILFDKTRQRPYMPYAIALTSFVLYHTIWYSVFYLF